MINLIEQQQISMTKRYGSEKGGKFSGNRFANHAGAAVFAPLIFTIPFPTMVDVGFQEGMRLIHGGNWMRNVMSGFVIVIGFPAWIWSMKSGITDPLLHITFP